MSFDTAAIKKAFFDRKAVQDSVSKGVRQALSKFGAFVRTRAKSSIRKRKGISAPGQPPSSHEGSLKKLIYFSYDAQQQSVVIGPVPHSKGDGGRLLEHGGSATRGVSIFVVGARRASPAQAKSYRAKLKSGALARPSRGTMAKVVHYKPRPFMKPAFDKELPNAPEGFKNLMK